MLNKSRFLLLILVILIAPTFWRMLRPGIFSMHDFHLIRLLEYRRCIEDLQIPCRWAPDAAFEYGQPTFNYYGQMSYVFGEIFHVLGVQVVDTLKILFILSIILSALTMFLLSKQLWKSNLGAFISSMIYVYAPYRAVDIWVRGALPESLAFIFFPLITYFFNDFILTKKNKSLLLLSLSFSLLVVIHNLSALMYLVFLIFWGTFFITYNKAWNQIPKLLLAGVLSLGLSFFYILPLIFETKLITLSQITLGYYDFRNHFVSLYQLLIQRYWGYGASLWGEDDRLSLSVGYIQWILPLVLLLVLTFTKKIKKAWVFLVLFSIGWIFLLLTHAKSVPIWEIIKPLSYIQFPWRFLGSAVFAFALSAGALSILPIKKIYLVSIAALITVLLILVNVSFFTEDIWYNHTDQDEFSGERWEFHISSAVSDFWPITAKQTPKSLAPKDPILVEGIGSGMLLEKRSNKAFYKVNIESEKALVQLPIVYFPGWVGSVDGKTERIYPSGDFGLITAWVERGDHSINLNFEDTNIRRVGNLISLLTFLIFITTFIIRKNKKNA